MAVPATVDNFGDLLLPGFRKIFNNQYQEIPSLIEELFNMVPSERNYEEDSQVGAFGDFENFTESGQVSYDEIYQGYDTRYNHIEWAKGFQVQRRLFDDDLYNIMNKKPMGLAISAKRSREKRGADIFNLNSAMPGPGGTGDGLSLFNDAHTVPSGAYTKDNDGTNNLTEAGIEATLIEMRNFRDDRNNYISVNPNLILISPNQQREAEKLVGSRGSVGTGDNDINPYYQRFEIKVWQYLTDTNAWYVIDKAYMKMFLIWFQRINMEFDQDKDFDSKVAKFSGYERDSQGFSDWRWGYRNNPT